MRGHRLAGALLMLMGCAGTAAAQTTDPPAQASPTEPASAGQADSAASTTGAEDDSKKWKFATIGYLWAASAKGETDVIGPVEPVGLDLSFGDVLKAFKFAFMGAAEAKKDRLVILGDLTFIHLEAKEGIEIRDRDFLDAELDSRTAEITLVGGYRVADKGPVIVDLLAGGRMNFFKTTVQLDGPNRSAEGSVKKSWFDPLIAARTTVPLGEKWRMVLYGDLGGIVTGSDVTWQLFGTVNYDISRKMTLGLGWRAFKVNYDDGDFLYDVAQSGPIFVFRTQF
jgi:hypothetical protein